MNLKYISVVLGLFLFFNFVFGQTFDFDQPSTSVSDIYGVMRVLNNILKVVYGLFFALAAIFILLAAFDYLTAQGNAEKVKLAQKKLTYAIIAIVIALVAVGVSGIVASVVDLPS